MNPGVLCRQLEWDTEFFGVRIGRIEVTRLTDDLMTDVLGWSRGNQLRCLYFLCDSDHNESVCIAEANGFHLVDIRIVFAKDIENALLDQSESELAGRIRPFQSKDLPFLQGIASSIYDNTRFSYDEHFDRQRVSDMYREWIMKSCRGGADAVLVARRQGAITGYITCHLDSPQRGRIGLMGVAAQMRGTGVGTALVHSALEYFSRHGSTRVEVATQGRNLAAQGLYQSAGFRTHSLQLWYHKWFEE
jgi:ribosomal protein S18 acetylase RimI-like enzyme